MMSLWDALRMNMMISYQELVRTFPRRIDRKLMRFLFALMSCVMLFAVIFRIRFLGSHHDDKRITY
ncbi:hypothetical protein DA718_29050 [Klebsiella huaxiensis]|nr:hypothetical protein DA718_29050 [Klebsiella huaxiensis]